MNKKKLDHIECARQSDLRMKRQERTKPECVCDESQSNLKQHAVDKIFATKLFFFHFFHLFICCQHHS